MGKNKAQKSAEERAKAAATNAATTQPAPAAPTEGTGIIVVSSEAMQAAIDLCGARQTAKAHKTPAKAKEARPLCGKEKKDGTPCTSRCMEGKETCVDHQPAWDRMTHEEHVAFGTWLRGAKGPEIVEVIGWWKAKQIAKDVQGPTATPEQEAIEK